jgi:hypothetical protein
MITFKEELDIEDIKFYILIMFEKDKEKDTQNYNHINRFELEVLLSIEDHREMVFKLYNKINRFPYYSKEDIKYIIEEVSNKCFDKVNDTYFTFLLSIILNHIEIGTLDFEDNKYLINDKTNHNFLFSIYLLYKKDTYTKREIKLLNVIEFEYSEENYYKGLLDMFNFIMKDNQDIKKQLEIDLTKYIKDNLYYNLNHNLIIIDSKEHKNKKKSILFKTINVN